MNPRKVVDAYRVDENLRIHPEYRPIEVKTRFSFAQDFGSFAHAAERCLGVAKCRNVEGGVMCPSYRVTGEEKHSTRGRIRLFGELFRGEALGGLWANEDVKEALDLCLACKSCKSECPVQVDMATYKAEFLSHYYETHPRPRQARSMGMIHRWARLASHAPGVANLVNATPGLRALAKHWAGIAPQRQVPKLPRTSYARWFARRGKAGAAGGGRVVLWPDTFNNYFRPEAAIAATQVLEAAGYAVSLPGRPLCCGRPLYDFGLLDQARAQLAEILQALRPEIEAGVPIVGLEPACVSVFKDELPNLFPGDPLARKLAERTIYFSDFLQACAGLPERAVVQRALVHGHCHHKALLGMKAEMALLRRAGIEARAIESGCCGMAGAFGFRPETYPLSVQLAENGLLPAVRAVAPDEIIVASGYSCREQIEQLSGRKTMHAAEAVASALGLNIAAGPTPVR
jgi:Fe-S oxidoreductase